MKISIIQFNPQLKELITNLNTVKSFLEKLPACQNHLVVLPELWSTGFVAELEAMADINEQFILPEIRELSKNNHVTIAGSYIHKHENTYTNQLRMIQPNNTEEATYHKIHLFSQMNEVKWFSAGTQPIIVNLLGINIGLSICYDLRFPELFRWYAMHNVEICILPSQWPLKRIDHFKTLLKGRAIENQMAMAACNVSGKIGTTLFGGSSQVIDHAGIVTNHVNEKEPGCITTEINIEALRKWREDFPVLKEIKTDIYKNLSFH